MHSSSHILDDNAVSEVVGTILIVLLTTMLAIIILSSVTLNMVENPPLAATVEGRAVVTGSGTTDQVVELLHVSGDSIPVNKTSVMVNVWRNNVMLKSETCFGFPVSTFAGATCSGDNIIDKSSGQTILGEFSSVSGGGRNGIWSPGEKIGLRIKVGGIRLNTGDKVQIKIVYIPSQLVIIDQFFTVTTS